MKPNAAYRQPLFEILTLYFSEGELRTLCFRLSIDFEDIPGTTKTDKARELILYCEKRDRIDQLITVGKEERQNAPWDRTQEIQLGGRDSNKIDAPKETTSMAGVLVSQTMAMVFVDLMRMFFVTSSQIAYDANVTRYDHFIRVTR